jgi:hypothetical protein
MNIKAITTLGLVALALVVTSIAPAEANDHSKYLNQLAMQYYLQNQAAAGRTSIYNPLLTGVANTSVYNPLLTGVTNTSVYNPLLTGTTNVLTTGATPWSAGAIPAYGTGATPWSAGCVPYGTTTTLGVTPVVPVYNNIISPNYNVINGQIATLQAQLAANNISSWQASRLQHQIAQLQAQQSRLASSGYGAPGVHRSNVMNNLRSYMHI